MERWRSSLCEGEDQMAGQLWDVGLMPFQTALFWPPHQSITITMVERDGEQWCRKSTSDNYNARDKIMGTRCTLPIISCISLWLTHPHTPVPPLTTAITGHICEIQNELIWWQQWGLWSVSVFARVLSVCTLLSNVREYLPLTSLLPCKTGTVWRYYCRMKEGQHEHGSISSLLRMGVTEGVEPQFYNNFGLFHHWNCFKSTHASLSIIKVEHPLK